MVIECVSCKTRDMCGNCYCIELELIEHLKAVIDSAYNALHEDPIDLALVCEMLYKPADKHKENR